MLLGKDIAAATRQISSICRLCGRSHPTLADDSIGNRACLRTRHQSGVRQHGSLLQKPNCTVTMVHPGRCHIVVCIADPPIADPSEFTRQGLLQDLTQADGLHDLIEVDTEATEVQRV